MAGREKRIFSLQEARSLLPLVKKMTAAAADQADELLERLELLSEDDPEYHEVCGVLEDTARTWVNDMQRLGCEVRELWLVEFDNGCGYFCWRHPEDELDYFHGYDEDLSARSFIC